MKLVSANCKKVIFKFWYLLQNNIKIAIKELRKVKSKNLFLIKFF